MKKLYIYYITTFEKIKMFYQGDHALRRFFGRNFFKNAVFEAKNPRVGKCWMICVGSDQLFCPAFSAFGYQNILDRQMRFQGLLRQFFAFRHKKLCLVSVFFLGERCRKNNERILSARDDISLKDQEKSPPNVK
ncbi:MAG: hypothetical protein IJW71_06560 [Clostridia bacterium]|nr:hypothetical protein [Clostridia bacterium]